MTDPNYPGENKAWELLASLDPDSVCRAAAVSFDASRGAYTLASFGMDFTVAVKERTITSGAENSVVLLNNLGHFFRLSVLWYLVSVKDIACAERLVKLEHVRGGEIFTKGSHRLPVNRIAERYGRDKEEFFAIGRQFGGAAPGMRLGDASILLYPLPRIPVILTLWLEDEEFPARADLLFDSTCDLQLPTDVIWSVAMMSLLILL